MMNASRLKLHTELCLILKSNNVYFQPPESIKMKFPAIVYTRSDIKTIHASDSIYNQTIEYKVTVIDHDPDSEIVRRMSEFKFATYERPYKANGLNHDVFTIRYKK